eukprot:Polyplicarium_translucidae@DN2327_c0_g1_i2.p1
MRVASRLQSLAAKAFDCALVAWVKQAPRTKDGKKLKDALQTSEVVIGALNNRIRSGKALSVWGDAVVAASTSAVTHQRRSYDNPFVGSLRAATENKPWSDAKTASLRAALLRIDMAKCRETECQKFLDPFRRIAEVAPLNVSVWKSGLWPRRAEACIWRATCAQKIQNTTGDERNAHIKDLARPQLATMMPPVNMEVAGTDFKHHGINSFVSALVGRDRQQNGSLSLYSAIKRHQSVMAESAEPMFLSSKFWELLEHARAGRWYKTTNSVKHFFPIICDAKIRDLNALSHPICVITMLDMYQLGRLHITCRTASQREREQRVREFERFGREVEEFFLSCLRQCSLDELTRLFMHAVETCGLIQSGAVGTELEGREVFQEYRTAVPFSWARGFSRDPPEFRCGDAIDAFAVLLMIEIVKSKGRFLVLPYVCSLMGPGQDEDNSSDWQSLRVSGAGTRIDEARKCCAIFRQIARCEPCSDAPPGLFALGDLVKEHNETVKAVGAVMQKVKELKSTEHSADTRGTRPDDDDRIGQCITDYWSLKSTEHSADTRGTPPDDDDSIRQRITDYWSLSAKTTKMRASGCAPSACKEMNAELRRILAVTRERDVAGRIPATPSRFTTQPNSGRILAFAQNVPAPLPAPLTFSYAAVARGVTETKTAPSLGSPSLGSGVPVVPN